MIWSIWASGGVVAKCKRLIGDDQIAWKYADNRERARLLAKWLKDPVRLKRGLELTKKGRYWLKRYGFPDYVKSKRG